MVRSPFDKGHAGVRHRCCQTQNYLRIRAGRAEVRVLPRFWGSYALSVQARNQNASNSAVFNEIATSLTASCQDSPWASRLSINVPVFFLIRALEVHCLHRKCVRTILGATRPHHGRYRDASKAVNRMSRKTVRIFAKSDGTVLYPAEDMRLPDSLDLNLAPRMRKSQLISNLTTPRSDRLTRRLQQ